MPGSISIPPDQSGGRLRLETLVRLRWLAVGGQTVTVLAVDWWLGWPLPLGYCLGLIALSAWLNLLLRLRFPASMRLSNRAAAALLAYDLLQLAGLLYLTGGLSNPFVVLLVAPVVVSATALPVGYTVGLGALATALASLLAAWSWPVPWPEGDVLVLPRPYLVGVWAALVSALVFMAAYSTRVAREARMLQSALAATELILSREQHLHQLDGLAAAAAHELGTPLATIALVAKELDREVAGDAPIREDIELLRSQSERCRDILGKLTSLSTDFGGGLSRQPLSHLIEDVVAPHREFDVEIVVTLDGPPGREPVGNRNPAILYGLGNIVENAVDFARSRVEVVAGWSDDRVTVTVRDDGPGFSPEVLDRIGEPYVTTRGRGRDGGGSGEAGGLGLGFFIAKTLLERTGARVHITNRAAPATGASVAVVWPRRAMEAPAPG